MQKEAFEQPQAVADTGPRCELSDARTVREGAYRVFWFEANAPVTLYKAGAKVSPARCGRPSTTPQSKLGYTSAVETT